MQAKNDHINYVEFSAPDLEQVKTFYSAVFSWEFTDYGPDYVAFANSGLDGGFERSDEAVVNGALVILYHRDLEAVVERIKQAGGSISKELFPFPGGRRFHFLDPAGNELGVWCEK
jgi:predicted enzyme related to lactoylglutathione lyase